LWKREWFGFHLTSVMLHACTAVGVYFVTRRLLASTNGAGKTIRSTPVVISATFTAALFAAHPLRAESVAWLAERRDVLAGFFYVLAVGCYLRYAAPGEVRLPAESRFGDPLTDVRDSDSGRRIFYAGAVLLCAVSLLAKASAISLPVVLVILDVYPLRRFTGYKPVPHIWLWIEKLPFFALALAAGARALIAQEQVGALHGYAQHDAWVRLAQACYGLMFYLWKTLWPTNLGPLYEIPPREVLFGPMLWLSVAVVLAVGFTAVRLRRRRPAVPAALALYLVILFPVLGFAQSGPQLVADRYSYLSCIGLAVLAGAALLRFLQSDAWGRIPNRRAIVALASILMVVSLAVPTYRQAAIWIAPWTLWARGVRASPNSAIAHTNYADALVRKELFAKAAHHYQRALELNPDDAVALHHYADLCKQFGHVDGAIYHYLRALRVDPDRQRACYSLAQMLIAKGRARKAVDVLRDGARRHPDALEMIDYLAQLLSTHPDENVRNAEEAVKWAVYVNRARRSRHVPALLTLATAYADAGRFNEAVDTARQALELAGPQSDDWLTAELERRLVLFREEKPYHFGEW
ncbi:MAG: tetratricopeptide repeat protein, partial [Phycisphaerae bacterium]